MPMSREELASYLDEHLPYERMMLDYTFGKITTQQSQCDWNAYYESFVIHARNLYNFLTNNDGTNAKAHEFVFNFKARKSTGTISISSKLLAQVHHLSPKRPSAAEQKVQADDARVLYSWIDDNFDQFIRGLPENLRTLWNESKSRPPPTFDNILVGSNAGVANHTATVTVSTVSFPPSSEK